MVGMKEIPSYPSKIDQGNPKNSKMTSRAKMHEDSDIIIIIVLLDGVVVKILHFFLGWSSFMKNPVSKDFAKEASSSFFFNRCFEISYPYWSRRLSVQFTDSNQWLHTTAHYRYLINQLINKNLCNNISHFVWFVSLCFSIYVSFMPTVSDNEILKIRPNGNITVYPILTNCQLPIDQSSIQVF